MNLSAHFTLDEMTFSQVATRLRLVNDPSPGEVANLRRLCGLLEVVRASLGVPVRVTSGYRSQALNAAVGGAVTSAHMEGRAADIQAPAYGSPLEVARRLAASGYVMTYTDQLILEFGSWVHIAIPATGARPRSQLLTIGHGTGGYLPGIVAGQ